MLVKLPNGLLDGTDLFNYAEVDELRGRQQNYLADVDLVVRNIGHIPKILEDLVKSLQTEQGLKWQGEISQAIWKLPSGDLETLLIKIRENTYGPKFFLEAACTHCEHVNKNLKLDLSTLEISPITVLEMMTPKKVSLPKMKVDAELKPLYLRDLFDVIKIAQDRKDSLITSMICTSVKRIGEKSKITPEDIGDIPVTDLQHLEKAIVDTKLEGHIDTMIQTNCKKCKKEFEHKLNLLDPSFFYPSKVSMS